MPWRVPQEDGAARGRLLGRSPELARRRVQFKGAPTSGPSTIYDWTASAVAPVEDVVGFDHAIGDLHDAVAVGNHTVWGDPLPPRLQRKAANDGASVPQVQRDGTGAPAASRVHAAAQHGISGGGSVLPHLAAIQASFGRHDVGGVQSYVGGRATDACEEMNAQAYATGNAVAFKGNPDLHTAAHEAAHIVQQRGGVSLKSGVGATGDAYERHADAVADRVVQGKSAEDLLDRYAGGSATAAVQRKDEGGARGPHVVQFKRKRERSGAGALAGVAEVAARKGGKRRFAIKRGAWTKIIRGLRAYEEALSEAKRDGTQSKWVRKALQGRVDKLIKQVTAYDSSHAMSKGKQNLQDQKEQAHFEAASMPFKKWQALPGNENKTRAAFDAYKQKLSHDDGPGYTSRKRTITEQRRRVIKALLPRLHQDRLTLDREFPAKGMNDLTRQGGESVLGSGNFNTVTVAKFNTETGPGQPEEKDGVFKKDEEQLTNLTNTSKKKLLMSGATQRNVAASKLDEFLGTNVIAKTEFSVVGGEFGIAMERAKGEGINDKEKDVDWSDPELQRQLTDLQWVDFFSGELDRHGDNFLVSQGDGETKVTGIDNDNAFIPKRLFGRGGQESLTFGRGEEVEESNKPDHISAELARRIQSDGFTFFNYKKMLEPILPKENLKVALRRFPVVKKHALELIKEGKVVYKDGDNAAGAGQMRWGSEEMMQKLQGVEGAKYKAGIDPLAHAIYKRNEARRLEEFKRRRAEEQARKDNQDNQE